MNKENELDYLVAVYGIIFFTLAEIKLIDKDTAIPKKLKGKEQTEKNQDSLAVYKWLSEKIRGISKEELQKRAERFNEISKSLEDDFYLNQFYMGLAMLQYYLESEASGLDKNMILPKVNRLMKTMRDKIIEVNQENDGLEITIDSTQAASNIWRMFNGKAQLTKHIRRLNMERWKESSRKKSKSLTEKYKIKI